MSKPVSKTLIGGFVVGAVGLVVAGVLIFGSGKFLRETNKFVMYFEGSVKGLNVGAPVVFRGVKVGGVTDIQLHYNPADMSVTIPVFIEIEPDHFRAYGGPPARGASPQRYLELLLDRVRGRTDSERRLRLLIERGLRARLQMQSLVTGQLLVEMDFHPDKPVKLVGGDTDYAEIPTIPSPLEELSKKIEKIPIEEIFKKLLAAVEGIEGIVNSPEVQGTIRSLNQAMEDARKLVRNIDGQVSPLASSIEKTLGDTRKLVRNVNSQVTPLASSIKGTVEDYGKLARDVDGQIAPLASDIGKTLEEARFALKQGGKALAGAEGVLAEDSPLLYELESALKEVSHAARAIRLLADYLKRHPEALLKGKGTSEGE
jgi:paraquat-inducible protein B